MTTDHTLQTDIIETSFGNGGEHMQRKSLIQNLDTFGYLLVDAIRPAHPSISLIPASSKKKYSPLARSILKEIIFIVLQVPRRGSFLLTQTEPSKPSFSLSVRPQSSFCGNF